MLNAAQEIAGPIAIDVVETRSQFERLAAEWDDLIGRAADVASPFLAFEWLSAWLDTYGVHHRPFVLVARVDDRLVGLWPLCVRRRLLFRVLEPLGAGRSDWLDVITDTGFRQAVMASFTAYLAENRNRWDLLELRDVLADSPNLTELAAMCGNKKLALRREQRTIAPYLPIQGTWDSFLASRSANFRSALRRQLKKALSAEGGLSVIASTSPGASTVDDFAQVESQSWKASEGTLKLTTAVGREFYQRFLTALAKKGLLTIWTAAYEGRVVAYLVLFVQGGKCYYYNGAYDERAATLSPGTVLHAKAIEDAFRRGLAEYDFLSGDEPYKARWTNERREIHHVTVSNGRLPSVVAFFALVWPRSFLKRSTLLRSWRLRVLKLLRRLSRRPRAG